MRVNREQLIFALSDTVDLVGIDELQHSKRVAFMAWQCGDILGYNETHRRHLFHLGLLHDCGVSSTETRRNLINDMEWNDADIHCAVGASRMMSHAIFTPFSLSIRYHHSLWPHLQKVDLDERQRLDTNLIFLLDRVDYLCQTLPATPWITRKDYVRHRINTFRNSYFAANLLDAFLVASEPEAFWFSLAPQMLNGFITAMRQNKDEVSINSMELLHTADLFAEVVDAKSRFTADHSRGVARLAWLIANLMQLDEDTCIQVQIAALLHDLGKLQVPDRFLDSTTQLPDEGLSYMRHHSYGTYRILKNIEGIEHIAEWAGNHHEALDGSGYPFRKTGEELDIASRIIAIADIFQALAQHRPYRKALPLSHILEFLGSHCDKGRLDPAVFKVVKNNSSQCYQQALFYQQTKDPDA